MITYPDFDEEFKINTNARDFQSGAVISQNIKTITFYSKKVTNAKKSYTVSEKEMLGIFETLKEFRTILLRQRIIIYTDHKNLTWRIFNNYRVLRWILILEEYGRDIEYIQRGKNIVVDALSIFPMNGNQYTIHKSTYKREIIPEIDNTE